MKTFNSIQSVLRGYKTYIIGAVMVGLGIFIADTQLILEGLGLITLRAGLAKTKQAK